jgi:SAM-dependent methyltransferase
LSSIYEVPVDPDAENNCHAFALSMIGYNKSVLEAGCSTGYITKFLFERGCNVVGIEIDPDAAEVAECWAERVVVGDLDDAETWNYVKDESFDVVVLCDVLEHLRDPLESMRQAVRKLKPSGYMVASLPNVAHGDVRIAMINGIFRYREWGLLDRTHVRFFTLETARQLFQEAGLVAVETKRVVVPLFRSEIGVTRADVNDTTLDELLADPEVETYQYVIKSVRDNGTRALNELATVVDDLGDRMHQQRIRIALLRKDRQALAAHQKYIKALEGHVSGLEHNIEVLNQSLGEADARNRALLAQRTPLMRGVYSRLKRAFKKNTG